MRDQPQIVRIGTRSSPLALHQAEQVKALLERASEGSLAGDIVKFTTTGDQLTTERLINSGGKGLFTKEIDRALDVGEVEIAVHSLKDVPSQLPVGQTLSAFMAREDPREGFLCNIADTLEDLPEGAIIGTASIRREAQTRLVRPDLKIIPFRGNVQTRLKKLEAGEAHATYLAMAGLSRLGLQHLAHPIELEDMLPAPCQGIVAIASVVGQVSPQLEAVLALINNKKAERAASAERGFLVTLDGSCRTPIGAHLFAEESMFRFVGEVTHPDGSANWGNSVYCSGQADLEELAAVGKTCAEALLEQVGGSLPQFEA